MHGKRPRTIFLGSVLPVAASLLIASAALAAGDDPKGKDEEKEKTTPPATRVEEKVVVTATRADESAPATHSNISHREIQEQHSVEDVPAMLRVSPAVFSYSDSGNDIGYSYLRIRGFDQQRINVTINGVPLNDAESHEVFWVDLPDFADSLQDIQVQRGAGTALYGAGAIGGAVNLETARLAPGEAWTVATGMGSYGTSRFAVNWKSELVADHWVFGARLSRIGTDGYRYQSWTRMGMGFFTAQRHGPRTLLRINLYGGRENSHLAYEGLTREQLAQDRRQNPLSWPGEQDHFTQPHLEVIHEWRPREELELANTVYAFYGKGYFDQFREDKDWFELHLADEYGQGEATNVFRQRWVREWDFGWLPRVRWEHGAGTLTAGLEVRVHRSDHYGTVNADNLPSGTLADFRYYAYEIPKNNYTAYVQEEWRPAERVTVLAGVQRAARRWRLQNDRVTGIRYGATYSWWAPRAGVRVRLAERLHGFASVSRSRREPAVKDLYDPQDAWDAPAFRHVDETGRAADPIPQEEKLTDYEAGLEYGSSRFAEKLTLYEMDFRNEIIYLGGINDLGQAITGNADKSVHRGVEAQVTAKVTRRLDLAAHWSVSEDRHIRYVEDGWGGPVDYSGNRVAGFPAQIGRLALAWRPSWGRLEIGGIRVGRIFVDNSESREASVDPYTVLHLDATYRLPWGRSQRYALRLRVNNLLDKEYESFGFNWGEPTFIPAAGRNAFVMLSFRPR